jgi:hypothetical protein
LDILEACGASDSGSNPGAGVLIINIVISTGEKTAFFKKISMLMKYKKHFNELFNIADLKVS